MPDMSRHLFYSAVLLLVVMMCCTAGGAAEAEEQSSAPKFKWKVVKDEDGVTVESLGVPGLLKVGSDVFAVAEATCGKEDAEDHTFIGIASQLLTMDKGKESKEEFPKDAKKGTKVLEKDVSKGEKKKVDVSRPTTVVNGKDIYMLVGKYSGKPAAGVSVEGGADDSGLLLVKGKVGDETNKQIDWKETTDLSRAAFGKELQSLEGLIGSGGSGFEMKGDKLVFPVEGMKSVKEGKKKAVSLLIYFSANEGWKLSKGMSDGGCSDPSVVEWGEKDKKLMMMTACDDGRRRVYESGDKGESWTEALGTLSRVWGNKHGQEANGVRSGFITATIGGVDDKRNVMLVTLPVYSKEADTGGNRKGKLHLWLTDNTHIVDIGPVSGDDAAASSLLYKSAGSGDNKKEEKLIALYEKKKDDGKPSHSLWSVLLTEQLQRVKVVLATWKKVDETVSKLCTSSAEEERSTESDCSASMPTDGLVGFLSGNFSNETWRDEYLGVNATVKNNDGGNKATLHEGSVKFRGAWAEWPVGKQGENQLYHFANYNFTLVATVSIDGEPKEGSPISLMGMKMIDDNNTVLLGLSYNGGGKWKLLCGGENRKELSSTWEKEATHHVVILLRNGTQGSSYVDGQRVGEDAQCDLKSAKDKRISHFHIGGDGGAKADSEVQDVSVTVTNVLLYNRPLDDDEINALNTKPSIPKARGTKTVKEGTQPVVSKQVTLETETPSSLGGQQRTEQGSLRTSENARSSVLSTSAVSSVTNSPAAKESENQSVSGKFPEGNPNVDVDSSSEEVQTVDAETGDTVQGDGTQQPSVGTSATADTNAPTAEIMAPEGTAVTPEVGAHSGEDGETRGGTDVQKEGIHAQEKEVNAAALSSSLGNVSQGNNSDAGTVRESGLPSLLLLLGLWVFAAL
ncbi:putative trans-sialidase [Trypanosoma cruzi]|nr:putative trans-sialidase [Trypanosoma cruzi]